MTITVNKLINSDRFRGENLVLFLAYLPFGSIILVLRIISALILWIAAIILPNKSTIRQMLSTFACWTFGVYVKLKGNRDPRCSVLVANYVSCLDSLAASHVLGTISLRKWKVPPFFASTLGIRNATQFVRKEHFADSPSEPILLQPEGVPTNGKGLLEFTDWPFQLGNRVQPVAITVERLFTNVTDHRKTEGFPWMEAMWFMISPVTIYTVTLLQPSEKNGAEMVDFTNDVREKISSHLQIPATHFKYTDIMALSRTQNTRTQATQPNRHYNDSMRLAAQVKEVLPTVPIRDILRDLAATKSVDITITNFLEGITPYTPEVISQSIEEPKPSTSTSKPSPKYITPPPKGIFAKNAKERQLTFQEKKAQMIDEARQKYIEKHGLNIALNNC